MTDDELDALSRDIMRHCLLKPHRKILDTPAKVFAYHAETGDYQPLGTTVIYYAPLKFVPRS